MITIFAPDGIAEVTPETDLAATVHDALAGDLQGGDIVVITSKIISKHENRFAPAADRLAVIDAETVRTVARRKTMAVVETRHGLTQAAAGVDNSNVEPGSILLLPEDADATAETLRRRLGELTGLTLGVIVSDTAGRAWRLGQTDHAIGAAGVRVIEAYDGRRDDYGNELHVTAVAIADELASAADLVKRKLAGRPVAVIRGLAEFVLDATPDESEGSAEGSGSGSESGPAGAATQDRPTARDLLRPGGEDLFRMGVRESVVHALLVAVDRAEDYEAVVRIDDPDELRAAITDGAGLEAGQLLLVDRMLAAVAEG